MSNSDIATKAASEVVQCLYCQKDTVINLPENYAPVYVYCDHCSKKFIAERLAVGFQLFKIGEAPCVSDPDCRDIEMGASDEQ